MRMPKEFHIFASDFESRFLVKGAGRLTQEFPSLVDATRHVRLQLGATGGSIAVYDGNHVNRIPVRPGSTPPPLNQPGTGVLKRILLVDDESGFTRLVK